MIKKSYNNTPTLYLIPTPIGNMEDITLRAIRVLRMVDVIFCEDTRVTKKLLDHFNIKCKLISNYEYNEEKNKNLIISYLSVDKNVGLVTDRGTPIISDPGFVLVSHVISNNFNVISLPGATAFTPALTSSGISPLPFLFFGFLNSKDVKRKKELIMLKNVKFTIIFYESLHRIIATLNNILEIMGDRNVSISREISKKFEEIFYGLVSEAIEELNSSKGEFVIVLEGNKEKLDYSALSLKEHIDFYLNQNIDLKEAMKLVAKERKTTKSIIYKEYHK